MTCPAVPIDLNPRVHGPPAGSLNPYSGMASRAPTATLTVLAGRQRSTVRVTELTVPLIDVTRPVVPAGIAMVTSRIAPALRTVARYVSVVVPFDACVAVTLTPAAAASAARSMNTIAAAATTNAAAEARSLRSMGSPQVVK